MARKTSVDDMRRELAKRAALRNQLVLRVFAGELTADQESLRQGAGRIFHHALCQRGQQDSPKEGTMLSKRTLLGALLAGLGVSLAGCYEPTAYSGAYYGGYGPAYGGGYYDGWGGYTGGSYYPWRYCGSPYYGGYYTWLYCDGPYYGGYYWRRGYVWRHGYYRYPYRHGVYYRSYGGHY